MSIQDITCDNDSAFDGYKKIREFFGLSNAWDGLFGLSSKAESSTQMTENFNTVTFYTAWSNSENVSKLSSRIGSYYTITDTKKDVKCVTNYLLHRFFDNNIYNVKTKKTSNFKPKIVSSGINYTPILENFILFVKRATRGVANEYVNDYCKRNFLDYVRKYGICEKREKNPNERCDVRGYSDVLSPTPEIPYDIELLYPDNEIEENKINNYLSLLNDYEYYVSENLSILKWCGCFAPGLILFRNSNGDGDGPEQVPDQCNPLCINNESQKLYDNNLNQINCQSAICVIDNNAIETVNYTGDVTFRQICKGCTSNQGLDRCFCIVDNSLGNVLEKIQSGSRGLTNQTAFEQVCPDSTCITINSDGNIRYEECNSFSAGDTDKLKNLSESGKAQVIYYEKIERNRWIFIIIFVTFIILIIIFDFFVN